MSHTKKIIETPNRFSILDTDSEDIESSPIETKQVLKCSIIKEPITPIRRATIKTPTAPRKAPRPAPEDIAIPPALDDASLFPALNFKRQLSVTFDD